MTTLGIKLEHLEAVLETLGQYEFAVRRDPQMPVGRVTDCGCGGPLPECKCRRRARLVAEVKALAEEAKTGREPRSEPPPRIPEGYELLPKKVKCPECGGWGSGQGWTCRYCDGRGEIRP